MPFFSKLTSRFSGAGALARSATSDDSATPTSRQLYELNALSFRSSALSEILGVLEARITSSSRHWRNISKGLSVLKYLLIHGSPDLAPWIQSRATVLTQLTKFSHKKGGVEVGEKVRQTASELLELARDPEKRAAEKAAYHKTRDDVRSSMGRPSSSRNTLEALRNMDGSLEFIESEIPPRPSVNLALGAIQEES